MDKLS